jgi:hypothetical protein
MRSLQRTLAILALLILTVQTTRHAYTLWLEPRGSVLDRFDQPVRDQVNAARSIEELLQQYETVHRQAEQLRATEERASRPNSYEVPEKEPFKSEHLLREAISDWESKAKEIRALRFYWGIGLALVVTGAFVRAKVNRWFGLTLVVTGFSEIIYWTSPSLLGPSIEGTRLLANKLALSAAGLAILLTLLWAAGVFSEDQPATDRPGG